MEILFVRNGLGGVAVERMIHVRNAPSPGATASPSIGRSITEMAAQNFSLQAIPERRPP